MNYKSKVFENSVEMDLCVSTFGKHFISKYKIQEKVIENPNVEMFRIKSLKDDLVYLLQVFPKIRNGISISDFPSEEIVEKGESNKFIYIIKEI